MTKQLGTRKQKEVSSTTEVVERIKAMIVAGDARPGNRLPTQRALQRTLGTTKVTVQRAFDLLSEQGFIYSGGSRGTFVSSHPPHVFRYALVLPAVHEPGNWSAFWTSLAAESVAAEKKNGCRIAVFHGVDAGFQSPDASRLLCEMETHQLAGVIFAFPWRYLDGTPLFRVANVPKVAIMSEPAGDSVPALRLDYQSFFDRALDYLVNRGRKRIAALNPILLARDYETAFLTGLKNRGLEGKLAWWLPVSLGTPETARAYTRLLVASEPANRPDALIISDDNLVDHVLAGLEDSGVRVPEDLEILAHGNFPLVNPSGPPLRRLGYAVTDVLGTCLDLLDMQRSGNAAPPLTGVQPVFEEEFVSRCPAEDLVAV